MVAGQRCITSSTVRPGSIGMVSDPQMM